MKQGHLTVKKNQHNGYVAKFDSSDRIIIEYGKTERDALNKVIRKL